MAGGGAWIDARVLPGCWRARRRPVSADGARALELLTPCELDVLRRVCRGESNSEIAAELRMDERTVKSHVSAVLAELGARDRAGAIAAALDAGLEASEP